MTLSSASTDAEVEAAFDDNADYDAGAGDVAKARALQQACRILLRRYGASQNVGAGSTSLGRNATVIENELKRVDAWLDINDTARSSGNVSVTDLREARR